jgi:hypothetical protein
VGAIPRRVLVAGQVGCLEDIQNWHIELFHDFHLLFVEILHTGATGIAQMRKAAAICNAFLTIQL